MNPAMTASSMEPLNLSFMAVPRNRPTMAAKMITTSEPIVFMFMTKSSPKSYLFKPIVPRCVSVCNRLLQR